MEQNLNIDHSPGNTNEDVIIRYLERLSTESFHVFDYGSIYLAYNT